MTTKDNEDTRVSTARGILRERADLESHFQCIARIGALEAAVTMLLEYAEAERAR